jgi:voltage-gated potassium channel
MDPVLVVAAILPLAVSLTDAHREHPAVWLDLVSWLIFLVDYVVHWRLRPGYWRSKGGVFDAVIVVFTAPLYLIPGLGRGRIMGAARLLRLGRVFIVSSHSSKIRDLGRRLGTAAMYSSVLIVTCAIIVDAAEPVSNGFKNIGDCLWWAMVTFTTVGYGDLAPITSAGRIAAVLLMLGGVALIGSLAASLASFLNKDDSTEDELEEITVVQVQLMEEVRSLRDELRELRQALQLDTHSSAPVVRPEPAVGREASDL